MVGSFHPRWTCSAGTTALGHTLLHIASLPFTSNQTALYNPDVADSIHCARTLDSRWFPHRMPSPLHIQFPKPQEGSRKPQPLTDSQQQAQNASIRLLLEWGGIDVRAKDIDGNTALHYLVRILLKWFDRRMEGKKRGRTRQTAMALLHDRCGVSEM
ncbi:Transient receptor potential channel, vanilloid 5/6 [Penicillium roqueforti FM164]|uniref:Transient receptor potential channel, vanilloid 5/6 n=1 Tax=Penicillium roqueforti (strain FM164) TaxID=1365484 RepID=W6QBN6_PENRF|nr:Transient receptor potential channel, vanilloid 5/6 [Penicillium roqueforti FM164]